MNYRKWKNKKIPISVLAAKLAEEAGEVAGAVADMEKAKIERGSRFPLIHELDKVNEEIAHARFFLDMIERRMVPE